MTGHLYSTDCSCDRCRKEGRRREQQTTSHRMLNDVHARGRRGRIARGYWDAYDYGRHMYEDDR